MKEFTTVNNKLITLAITNFWNVEINKLVKKHITVLFRIKATNGSIVTIGKMIKLNTSNQDLKTYIEYILNRIHLKTGGYSETVIAQIEFNYAIFEGKTETDYSFIDNKVVHFNYNHYKLPVVNPFDDMLKYGHLLAVIDNSNEEENKINKTYILQAANGNVFVVESIGSKDHLTNNVTLKKNGLSVLTYVDKAVVNKDTFTRSVESRDYLFSNNGEQLFMKIFITW